MEKEEKIIRRANFFTLSLSFKKCLLTDKEKTIIITIIIITIVAIIFFFWRIQISKKGDQKLKVFQYNC